MNKPFSRLSEVQAPARLLTRLSAAIDEQALARSRRSYRAKLFGYGILQIASVGALCWSVVYVSHALQISGIYEYLSLVFTDGTSVFAYAKEIALSVAESLPVMACISLLAACLATLVSAQKLYSNYGNPSR